jgi:hypothetical protein
VVGGAPSGAGGCRWGGTVSGRQAKAARRRDRLTEALLQAHDRLHKDDVDGCHEIIHAALGAGELPDDVAPLAQRAGFDREFQRICVEHGVRAAYVAVDSVDGNGRARMLSGGEASVVAMIDRSLRAQGVAS